MESYLSLNRKYMIILVYEKMMKNVYGSLDMHFRFKLENNNISWEKKSTIEITSMEKVVKFLQSNQWFFKPKNDTKSYFERLLLV